MPPLTAVCTIAATTHAWVLNFFRSREISSRRPKLQTKNRIRLNPVTFSRWALNRTSEIKKIGIRFSLGWRTGPDVYKKHKACSLISKVAIRRQANVHSIRTWDSAAGRLNVMLEIIATFHKNIPPCSKSLKFWTTLNYRDLNINEPDGAEKSNERKSPRIWLKSTQFSRLLSINDSKRNKLDISVGVIWK